MPAPSVRPNLRVAPAAKSSPDASVPPVESQEAVAHEPLIRIRTLLMLGVLVGAALLAWPRMQAAWKLHTSATALADYGLCMVGPTGPALLRDGSTQFRTLVRRRLVNAEANDRLFQDCAKLAFDLTGSMDAERAHRAPAWTFAEYRGGTPARGRGAPTPELSLDALEVNGRGLSELAHEAWPFVRDGYVKLVKPSLAAHEAVHPVEPPRPGIGRGLPNVRSGYRAVGTIDGAVAVAYGKAANLAVFKSSDGGLNWKPAPVRSAEAFAERCPAGERSYAFSLSSDSSRLMVTSSGGDAPPLSVTLAKADTEVVAAACDERGLVAALRAEGEKEIGLELCLFRGRCSPIQLPRFAGVGVAPKEPLDIARSQGVTMIATAMNGIVRVSSTRDDGQTWTPFTVAYDDGEWPDLRVDVRVPTRLLVIGKRTLLFGGGAKPDQTYSVLVSDDLGASFRSPDAREVVAQAK